MGILNLIKRHPVLFYYILVFTISWGGILLLVGGLNNVPGTYEQASRLFIPALLIMFSGPFFSGIMMNYLVGGSVGLRDLWSRFLRWGVNARWYTIAFLTGPLSVAIVLFGLSIFSKDYLPGIFSVENKLNSILFGIGWGLVGGGLFEETGWTGFAVPQLLKRHSVFVTGLIVGALWGIWHFMIAIWSSNYLGGSGSWILFVAGFLTFYLLALPAYRILLVFVYNRTKSLLVVMLMHAFLSASTLIMQPTSTGIVGVVWNSVLGLFFWIIVLIVTKDNSLRKKFEN